jgi:hypothetical protein
MSSSVTLNSSSTTGAIKGFENIATSSTMIEFFPTSTKTKGVAIIIWHLHLKEVDAFILKIRIGLMCGSDNKIS